MREKVINLNRKGQTKLPQKEVITRKNSGSNSSFIANYFVGAHVLFLSLVKSDCPRFDGQMTPSEPSLSLP